MLKQLGKYDILRTLGQGAMGEVYLAHHPAIGRDVAIKTILPSEAKSADAEERFRREAGAAGKLNHPNIVTVYDFDKEDGLLYLVMEYVKGEDLEDIIQQQSMSPGQFLEVLAQICDGLGHAHRHGIIHRDIKPSNIRVIRDGKRILAKVMDFGIARTSDSRMTATGIVMGTVSYMAPEYIQTGSSSAQGDLWAVGVMLYECLARRKPFGGENTTTILFKIVSETPPPIDLKDVHGISPSIQGILDRALSRDLSVRFQTAEDFAKALRACKDPSWSGVLETTSAAPASQARPVPPRFARTGDDTPTAMTPADLAATTKMGASRPPKPRWLALAGLAAVVLAGVGTTLWFRTPPRGSVAEPQGHPLPSTPPPGLPQVSGAPLPAVSEAKPAPVPETRPTAAPPAATTPAAPVSAAIGAAVPAPPKADPPKPAEETPAQLLDRAISLINTDPAQAASLLRTLASAQPADQRVQGNFLAALYRSRNAAEFDRAYSAARAQGLSVKHLIAVPAFKAALADESRLQRANAPDRVLSEESLRRLTADL